MKSLFVSLVWVCVYWRHGETSIDSLSFDNIEFNDCKNKMLNFTNPTTPTLFVDWFCMKRNLNETEGLNLAANRTVAIAGWLTTFIKQAKRKNDRKHPRIRQEYRTLTDDQRERFHSAIKRLKNDLLPSGTSKFDAIAKLHTGARVIGAHGGPGFLTWHRQYLLIIEDALREYFPDVAIPYWDSSLDSEMDNSTESIMWDERFMGDGVGIVTNGPFSNWRSPTIPLARNIGRHPTGRLFNQQDLTNILSQKSYGAVTLPNAAQKNCIEVVHGDVHDWVGGHMGSLQTASFDPVFFLHHSYIDYIFYEFQQAQKASGIKPGYDWPKNFGNAQHSPDRRISISDGMTHLDIAREDITAIYTYKPSPSCVDTDEQCGSPYLRCDKVKKRCVPLTKTQAKDVTTDKTNTILTSSPLIPQVHNSLCIQPKKCGAKYWVYIPIQVLYENKNWVKSHGKLHLAGGIGSNIQITHKVGIIHVQSYGLNYDGFHSDNVALDKSLPISSTTTVIAVKNPRYGKSMSLIRVYEANGKICRATCIEDNMATYGSCSGAINVTSQLPRSYSLTEDSAYSSLWLQDTKSNLIARNNVPIALTFQCGDNM